MKNKVASFLIAFSSLVVGSVASFNVNAQSNISTLSAVSMMPVASVVAGTSAAAGAVVAVPVVLATTGAVLLVKAVQATAQSTVYVLERASDGAQASVEILGKGIAGASVVAGTAVTVSVISAGVVLSAAGEAIAFIPNAVGRALLHNERLSH
jgi:uncharacterized membrane protein